MSRWPRSYPLAAPVALAALLPVVVLVLLATQAGSFLGAETLEIALNTLVLTLGTVLGSLLLGVPLAFLTAYVELPARRLWLIALVSPLAMPSYIGGFTFYAAFGPGGVIEQLFGITLPRVDGMAGAILVMTLYTFPFVLLTTRASLRGLDGSVVDAGRTLGLSLPACLIRLVVPRVWNGIAAGAVLVALYTLSDFGTPAIMQVDTFTRVIYVEYTTRGLSDAALLSLQLLVIVALVLFIESRVKTAPERPGQGLSLWPGRAGLALLLPAVAWVPLLAIGLPLLVFGAWLVQVGAGEFQLVYAWHSALASLLAALVAVVLAVPVAYAAIAGVFGRLMERASFLGFGIPGIVMGTALLYLGLQLSFLYQTLALLVFAYVLRFLPLAVSSIRSTAERLDGKLTQAARTLGASERESFRRVSLPLTLRGLVAGGALVFLEAMRELPATLLLRPTGFETLATYLWRVYEAGYFGRAAIPGLVLVLISGLGLAVMLAGERRAETGLLGMRDTHD